MVKLYILTLTPAAIDNTSTALFPLTATEAPAPVMVTLVLIVSVLARVIAPETPKFMVSPDAAPAIAALSEPAPLSFRLVTVIVLAEAGAATKAASNVKPAQTPESFLYRFQPSQRASRKAKIIEAHLLIILDTNPVNIGFMLLYFESQTQPRNFIDAMRVICAAKLESKNSHPQRLLADACIHVQWTARRKRF